MKPIPGTPPAKVGELARISDRMTFLYLEHAIVHRDGNAITVRDERGVVHVPAESRYNNGSDTTSTVKTMDPSLDALVRRAYKDILTRRGLLGIGSPCIVCHCHRKKSDDPNRKLFCPFHVFKI